MKCAFDNRTENLFSAVQGDRSSEFGEWKAERERVPSQRKRKRDSEVRRGAQHAYSGFG